MKSRHLFSSLLAVALVLTVAAAGTASAPPVGPLPAGPTTTIQTQVGQLVAVALPNRGSARAWRMAGTIDASVLAEVSEGNVGASVVIVFKAKGKGTANVSFGITRGETKKAYEARRFSVTVR